MIINFKNAAPSRILIYFVFAVFLSGCLVQPGTTKPPEKKQEVVKSTSATPIATKRYVANAGMCFNANTIRRTTNLGFREDYLSVTLAQQKAVYELDATLQKTGSYMAAVDAYERKRKEIFTVCKEANMVVKRETTIPSVEYTRALAFLEKGDLHSAERTINKLLEEAYETARRTRAGYLAYRVPRFLHFGAARIAEAIVDKYPYNKHYSYQTVLEILDVGMSNPCEGKDSRGCLIIRLSSVHLVEHLKRYLIVQCKAKRPKSELRKTLEKIAKAEQRLEEWTQLAANRYAKYGDNYRLGGRFNPASPHPDWLIDDSGEFKRCVARL